MSVESYQPCPCGSGKKLKFCCGNVFHEMQKIERQLENDQTVMGLQGLDRVLQAHPDADPAGAGSRINLAIGAWLHLSANCLDDARHRGCADRCCRRLCCRCRSRGELVVGNTLQKIIADA